MPSNRKGPSIKPPSNVKRLPVSAVAEPRVVPGLAPSTCNMPMLWKGASKSKFDRAVNWPPDCSPGLMTSDWKNVSVSLIKSRSVF